MSDIDYKARVARGIALMDEKWPDWATEIDLEKLDIESSSHCVTAQYSAAYGGDSYFTTGMKMLRLDENAYIDHGFNAECGDDWEYRALNALWRSEIERRRAQAQDAPAQPEPEAGA